MSFSSIDGKVSDVPCRKENQLQPIKVMTDECGDRLRCFRDFIFRQNRFPSTSSSSQINVGDFETAS